MQLASRLNHSDMHASCLNELTTNGMISPRGYYEPSPPLPCSYRQLGKSDLVVSEVCLGTMTWGEQNSDEEAFDQLNLAYDEFGVNFIVSLGR